MVTPAFDALDTTHEIPWEGWRRLRREAPVSRTPNGIWFLAKQADVLEATRDVDTFRASFREPGVVVQDEEMLISEIPEPRHGKMRKIVNSAIAAHRLGRVEGDARRITANGLDAVAGREAELVHEFVMPIPTSVIANLLGAPEDDYPLWGAWSDEVVQGDYPRLNRNDRGEGLSGAHPEFTAYIDAMIEDRRKRDPNDGPVDFVTRLLHTEVDGNRLGPVELRTLLAFLLISGNETTRHLLANLMLRIARDEAFLPTLRENPALVANAVEESLRLEPPVLLLMREVMQETEMFGPRMKAGDSIAFGIASANRDEDVYDEPDAFRLDRAKPKAHVAFGGGPHVCPGSALARLEARVLLEVAIERIEHVELAPGFEWQKVPVFWANGPAEIRGTVHLRE